MHMHEARAAWMSLMIGPCWYIFFKIMWDARGVANHILNDPWWYCERNYHSKFCSFKEISKSILSELRFLKLKVSSTTSYLQKLTYVHMNPHPVVKAFVCFSVYSCPVSSFERNLGNGFWKFWHDAKHHTIFRFLLLWRHYTQFRSKLGLKPHFFKNIDGVVY